MQPPVYAVQVVVFILDLAIGGFSKLNDALMAAAGDAHQPFVLNIKLQRLFPIDPADNGYSKYKRGHTRDDRI